MMRDRPLKLLALRQGPQAAWTKAVATITTQPIAPLHLRVPSDCGRQLKHPITMVWPFNKPSRDEAREESQEQAGSWTGSLHDTQRGPLTAAREWAPMVGFSVVGLVALQVYSNYLRRIPGAAFVRKSFFNRRSLFGRVSSVGDGDNFHLFHTPGGKAVGWGWLRKVPESRKELKDRTVRTWQMVHIVTLR